MNLFKGYIPSNGKQPLESIKDSSGHLESPPQDGDYVGLLKEDIIQLDFDTEEDARKAMAIVSEYKLRCDILETTRGVHLYFLADKSVKSQSVEVFNACGLKCDIGLGAKNRVAPLRVTKKLNVTHFVDGEAVTTK